MPTAVAQEVFPEDLTSHAGMTAAIDSGSEGHSEESEVVLPFNVASDGETPCPRPPPCVPQKTQCEFPSKGGDLLLPKSGMKGRENESLRFKIIVVGESGLGKSTAIDCLTAKLRKQHAHASEGSQGLSSGANDPRGQIQKTVKITENDEFELLTEERERTFLRIVDTPGYGDNVDCSADMGEICNYIEKQWERFRVAPKGVRAVEHDSLVTCCLYFIAPHRLKEIDINFLQKVSAMVPCVPVIAKSDTMTVEEAAAFREEVAKSLLDTEGINLYDWRYGTDKAEDESVSSYRRRYEHENGGRGRKLPPFTLVADTSHSVRHYPWGDCQLENEEHSDFALLRKLLLQARPYTLTCMLY
jgi:septin family protein